jgi:hypothetical protein
VREVLLCFLLPGKAKTKERRQGGREKAKKKKEISPTGVEPVTFR